MLSKLDFQIPACTNTHPKYRRNGDKKTQEIRSFGKNAINYR